MTQFSNPMRKLLACGLALLATFIPWKGMLAHADYEQSEPPANAVVTAAPPQVRVYFTQELFRRQGMNRIEVYGPDGRRVDQADPLVDDDNRRLLTVSLLPGLADGLYTVRWFSLSSEDGHEGEGEFSFTVGAAGSAAGETTTVTTTAGLTATGEVTPDETAPTTAVAATLPGAPTEEPATVPAPTPAAPSSASPCLGGATPLGLALGLVWIGRRRTAASRQHRLGKDRLLRPITVVEHLTVVAHLIKVAKF